MQQGLQGLGEKTWRVVFDGFTGFIVARFWKGQNIDVCTCDVGCTTVWMYTVPLNSTKATASCEWACPVPACLCSFPNPTQPFHLGQLFYIPCFLCMYLLFYSSYHFPSWNLNSKWIWALHFNLYSTQHSKPYLINVLSKEEVLKLEADMTNAYLIEGY